MKAGQKHPWCVRPNEQEAAADARWRMERSTLLPDLTLGVASMTLVPVAVRARWVGDLRAR
jgi:hypothetical protein